QTILAKAPYSRIPVFVKEGSLIPLGRALQYTSQKPEDTLDLILYGEKKARFSLYEDDGETYQYQKGKYSSIDFDYNPATRILSIRKSANSFKGMLQKRIFRIYRIDKAHSAGIDNLPGKYREVDFRGKDMEVKL
ncbi:MAG: DUF5110 domain-containing protein, partial [Bacteroidota bacterium]|nr:DUF5110 domain-containing protein [Bacteroidota bacterium]